MQNYEKLRKDVAIHMGKPTDDPGVEAVMQTFSNTLSNLFKPDPKAELRKKVEIKMLWLTHTMQPSVEKSVIDCIMELLEGQGGQESE